MIIIGHLKPIMVKNACKVCGITMMTVRTSEVRFTEEMENSQGRIWLKYLCFIEIITKCPVGNSRRRARAQYS